MALPLTLTVANAATQNEGYSLYVNERYGFEIYYPSNFVANGVSDSGDGQIFRSSNGDAEIRAYAAACVEGENATIASYIAKHRGSSDKGDQVITYHRQGKNYVIVSGFVKDKIFYDKLFIHDDWCTEFTFEYVQSQKAKYNPVAVHIEASFKQ